MTLPCFIVLASLIGGPSHEVVLGTFTTKAAARQTMTRAGWMLDRTIALNSLSLASAHRQERGTAIAAHRDARGRIVVSTFVGDGPSAAEELARVRRFFPSASIVSAPPPPDPAEEELDDSTEHPFVTSGILIVASSASYDEAVQKAKGYSDRSKATYDSQGRVFDPKRGLILADDDPDEIYAGRYVARRDDGDGKVTVERSEGYAGFKPHLYLVVAGIIGRGDVAERLRLARLIAPDAYVKPTILYMGCMH